MHALHTTSQRKNRPLAFEASAYKNLPNGDLFHVGLYGRVTPEQNFTYNAVQDNFHLCWMARQN